MSWETKGVTFKWVNILTIIWVVANVCFVLGHKLGQFMPVAQ